MSSLSSTFVLPYFLQLSGIIFLALLGVSCLLRATS